MSDLLSDSLRVHIHRFPSCRRFPSVPRLSPIVYLVQNDLALSPILLAATFSPR